MGFGFAGSAAAAALQKLIPGGEANPKATTILGKIRSAAESRAKLKAALQRECASNDLLLENCVAALKASQRQQKLNSIFPGQSCCIFVPKKIPFVPF